MKSLIGKWFILRQSMGGGMTMLSRGRVLGRADDMYPIYLAEVWPQDDRVLTARSQIVITIEELRSAFLFDDEAIWQEHFRDIITQLEAMRREAEVKAKAAERKLRRKANLPDEMQIIAIDEDQMKDLLDRFGGRGEKE